MRCGKLGLTDTYYEAVLAGHLVHSQRVQPMRAMGKLIPSWFLHHKASSVILGCKVCEDGRSFWRPKEVPKTWI